MTIYTVGSRKSAVGGVFVKKSTDRSITGTDGFLIVDCGLPTDD
jgi:hypothetical protein